MSTVFGESPNASIQDFCCGKSIEEEEEGKCALGLEKRWRTWEYNGGNPSCFLFIPVSKNIPLNYFILFVNVCWYHTIYSEMFVLSLTLSMR